MTGGGKVSFGGRWLPVILLTTMGTPWLGTLYGECSRIPQSPIYSSWQQDQTDTVTVYVDTSGITSADAVQGIRDAAANWSSQGLGVTFSVVTIDGPPVPTGRYIIVEIGLIAPNSAQTTWSGPPTSYTANALTTVDPSNLSSSNGNLRGYFGELMAHEMGHPFGLGDCTAQSCQGTSAMSVPFSLSSPSSCDVESIQFYYNDFYFPGSGNGSGATCGYTSYSYEYTTDDTGEAGCDCFTTYEVTDYYYCGTYLYSTQYESSYWCTC